jgi:hypothetical protein
MPAAADELRRELRELCERRGRGEIPDRDFTRQVADGSVALCRAVVLEQLAPAEHVLAEHHLVHSHFQLTQSLLREPEQAMVSLFATERRLLRVRGSLWPGRPVTCDAADGTVVDALEYARIREIVGRSQRRWGESAAGSLAVLLAVLLGDRLAITGPMLIGLGCAGALHGLLLPTRWIEIVAAGTAPPPFAIHGVRRRSARQLLAVVRDGVGRGRASADDQTEEA